MRNLGPSRRAGIALVATAIGVLGLSACSSGSTTTSSSPTASAAGSAKLNAMLPADVRQRGVLRIGMTAPFAPYVITDTANKITGGISPDITSEVAKRLGLKPDIQNVPFESALTSVGGGRLDVFDDGLSDLAERHNIGTFVDYMTSDSTLVTLAKNAASVKSRDDACGKTIAAGRGTTDVTYAQQIAAACVAKGLPAATVVQVADQPASDLALRSGRTAFQINVVEAIKYAIKQGSPVAIVGDPFKGSPVGTFVAKNNTQLSAAILAAMKEMQADGTLSAILGKYGITPVPQVAINLTTG